MKLLLVLLVAVGLASADIGLTYKVPEASYGVPSYQYNNNADYNIGYTGAGGYNYKAESSAQAGFQQDLGNQAGYQYGKTSIDNFNAVQNGYQYAKPSSDNFNAGYQTANYQSSLGNQFSQTGGSNSGYNTVAQPSYQYTDASAQSGGYQYQTTNEYQSSAVQKYQQFYKQWQQAPAQVFKHFYVHAAPEEPELPKIRQPVALPPPQKHYKIIFIKAPTQTVYQPQYVPVPQPNEEKTIVYVLVKKPEEQQELVVPKVEQKPPTKPEVFFIKYNNKADSSAVINNIVSDYNKVDAVNFATPGSENQFSSGQYNQGVQSGASSQGSFNQFGGLSTQAVSAGTASTAGYNTGATGTTDQTYSTISTSQGVPHETYGPPKFRV